MIPMHTPDEAIAELEFVRQELGLKAVLMNGMVPRPVPAAVEGRESAKRLGSVWYDVFGIDSDHDYDPVWAACIELGISPTFHAGGRGYALRRSPSNFTYNHIGISRRRPKPSARHCSWVASRAVFRVCAWPSWKAGPLGRVSSTPISSSIGRNVMVERWRTSIRRTWITV
jgi:hypothetical protein